MASYRNTKLNAHAARNLTLHIAPFLNRASIFCLAVLLSLLSPLSAARRPQPDSADEYRRKAECIHNILLFAEWPPHIQTKKTITICILGDDPFRGSFRHVQNKPVGPAARILRIRRLGPYTPAIDLKDCDVLFISRSEYGRLEDILRPIQRQPILTVADCPDFLHVGGMVQLIRVNHKIHWNINLRPAKDARLKLSAQLLRNAAHVVCIPPDEDCSLNNCPNDANHSPPPAQKDSHP